VGIREWGFTSTPLQSRDQWSRSEASANSQLSRRAPVGYM